MHAGLKCIIFCLYVCNLTKIQTREKVTTHEAMTDVQYMLSIALTNQVCVRKLTKMKRLKKLTKLKKSKKLTKLKKMTKLKKIVTLGGLRVFVNFFNFPTRGSQDFCQLFQLSYQGVSGFLSTFTTFLPV